MVGHNHATPRVRRRAGPGSTTRAKAPVMPIRIRIGRGGKGRLSARILTSQLVILTLTGAIGFVLLAFAQRAEIDRAYEQRALDIAQTTAAEPQIRQAVAHGG